MLKIGHFAVLILLVILCYYVYATDILLSEEIKERDDAIGVLIKELQVCKKDNQEYRKESFVYRKKILELENEIARYKVKNTSLEKMLTVERNYGMQKNMKRSIEIEPFFSITGGFNFESKSEGDGVPFLGISLGMLFKNIKF